MRSLLLVLALSLLAGCTEDTRYRVEDYDDVALAVGMLVGGDNTGEAVSVRDAVHIASGAPREHLAEIGHGAFEAQRAGLTHTYEVDCEDAAGRSLRRCNAGTDTATLALTWDGFLDLASYDADVVRSGSWTLSDVRRTPTLNGHGTFDVATELDGLVRPAIRTYELEYDAWYRDVRYDKRTEAIASGAIQYSVRALRTVTRDGERSEMPIDVLVDIVFHDDGSARIDVDGAREYTLDVETGRIDIPNDDQAL